MTTKIVRIPVPQALWDKVRATATKHLQATIDHERATALYATAQDCESQAMRIGRDIELLGLIGAESAARDAFMSAVVALAKAEADHIMGAQEPATPAN